MLPGSYFFNIQIVFDPHQMSQYWNAYIVQKLFHSVKQFLVHPFCGWTN